MTFDIVTSNHMEHSHKLCNISEDEPGQLPALPERFLSGRASSPRGSPLGSPIRQRSQTIDCTAFPRKYRRTRSSPCRIPKDPIQPKEGSITDIHSDCQVDDVGELNEDPFFSELPDFRSRSQTCPESMMRRRKEKVRALHRPSTPPPTDLCGASKTLSSHDIDQRIDSLVHMEER